MEHAERRPCSQSAALRQSFLSPFICPASFSGRCTLEPPALIRSPGTRCPSAPDSTFAVRQAPAHFVLRMHPQNMERMAQSR